MPCISELSLKKADLNDERAAIIANKIYSLLRENKPCPMCVKLNDNPIGPEGVAAFKVIAELKLELGLPYLQLALPESKEIWNEVSSWKITSHLKNVKIGSAQVTPVLSVRLKD